MVLKERGASARAALTAAVNEREARSLSEAAQLSGREEEGTDSGPTTYSPINQSSAAKVSATVS